MESKWERRDRKEKNKHRKMKVSGKGVQNLNQIVIDKARKAKKELEEEDDTT